MIRCHGLSSLFIAVLLLPVLVWASPVAARAATPIAEVRVVSGPVDILRGGALPAVPARVGDRLSMGDVVRTKRRGYAEVLFWDGALLKVSPGSRVDLGEYRSRTGMVKAHVRLARGKVEAVVDPVKFRASVKLTGRKRFEIHTPNCVAGVKGTDFIVSHQRFVSSVFVKRGAVYTYNRLLPNEPVTVTAGRMTAVTAKAPPLPPRIPVGTELKQLETVTPPANNGKTGEGGGETTTGTTGTVEPTPEASVTSVSTTSLAPTTELPVTQQQSITPVAAAVNTVPPPVTVTPPPPPPPPAATTPVTVNVNFN